MCTWVIDETATFRLLVFQGVTVGVLNHIWGQENIYVNCEFAI